LGTSPGECLLGVTLPTPEIIDPGEDQPPSSPVEPNRRVPQHLYPGRPECVGDCPVQTRIAANTEGIADREIVISENGVHPQRGFQVADQIGCRLNVPIPLVDEVSRQGNHVWLLGNRPGEGIFQIPLGNLVAAMEVGEMSDLESSERVGKVTHW
jgi:hypothetical protein